MSSETHQLLRDLQSVDRRLENARYLIGFQEKKRERIVHEIRKAIGRSEPRTQPIDYDARRDPKTDRWCVACQKDIAPDARAGIIRLVHVGGGCPSAVHADDIGLIEIGILTFADGDNDVGDYVIGLDCAKRLGAGWWRPEDPKKSK